MVVKVWGSAGLGEVDEEAILGELALCQAGVVATFRQRRFVSSPS